MRVVASMPVVRVVTGIMLKLSPDMSWMVTSSQTPLPSFSQSVVNSLPIRATVLPSGEVGIICAVVRVRVAERRERREKRASGEVNILGWRWVIFLVGGLSKQMGDGEGEGLKRVTDGA